MVQGVTKEGILGSGALGFPTKSHDFERSSSQYLSMTQANFGYSGLSRTTCSNSVWVEVESVGSNQTICSYENQVLAINSSNKIRVDTVNTSSGGVIITTATYSAGSFIHIYYEIDTGASGTNRIRLWVDGTEITAFDLDINPSGSLISTGSQGIGISASGNSFDGLVYQCAYFDAVKAGISNVYDGGSPMDVRALSGLHSLPNAGVSAVADYVLASDWVNNNGAVTVTTTP